MSEQQEDEHWTGVEPKVCGDVLWCGLPAGHGLDLREEPPDDVMSGARLFGLGEHRITVDGVYDLPADVYHLDPVLGGSLSSTGAKRLLPPNGCPAKFDHVRRNGQPDRPVWDEGRAAHTKILGVGALAEVVDPKLCAKDGAWSTKEAKAEVARIRAAGHTPVKPETAQRIDAMAEALLAHPQARQLIVPGKSEQAIFYTDPETGVTCRTMLDKLPPVNEQGRLILADYKTCHSASPQALQRAMSDNGTHLQAEWIMTLVEGVGLCGPGDAAVVFVCQEKKPPYVVTPYYPDSMALFKAAEWNRYARRTYAECERTGRWPGYVEGIIALSLPPWDEKAELPG